MITKSIKNDALNKMKASFIAGHANRKIEKKIQPSQAKPPHKIRVVCSTGNGCAS